MLQSRDAKRIGEALLEGCRRKSGSLDQRVQYRRELIDRLNEVSSLLFEEEQFGDEWQFLIDVLETVEGQPDAPWFDIEPSVAMPVGARMAIWQEHGGDLEAV
jgi:hypothetical protein